MITGLTELTLRVCHVLDHIAVFHDLDYAANESLCSLWGVVDCDECVRAFRSGGHCELEQMRWDIISFLIGIWSTKYESQDSKLDPDQQDTTMVYVVVSFRAAAVLGIGSYWS